MDNRDDCILNAKEAAEFVSLPESRIRRETFLKRIPHIKIGRSVRYSKNQLNEWLLNKTIEVQNEN